MQCGDCQYFVQVSPLGNGFCCRYPPVVIQDRFDGNVSSRFPATNAGEYCGEHETKLELTEG